MQRAGNAGVPRGIWPESGTEFPVSMPVQQLHLNRIGQNSGVIGPTKLWNMESGNSGSATNDRASLLGTKQWGRESGGAPWGQSSPADRSSVNPTPPITAPPILPDNFGASEPSSSSGMGLSSANSRLGFNLADYVLGTSVTDSSVMLSGGGGDFASNTSETHAGRGNGGSMPIQSQLDATKISEIGTDYKTSSSESTKTHNSRESSPTEGETKDQQPGSQNLQTTTRASPSHVTNVQGTSGQYAKEAYKISSSIVSSSSLSAPDVSTSGSSEQAAPPDVQSTLALDQAINAFPRASDVEFGGNQSTDATIEGVLQHQMNQLSLDYNTQQQTLAVQLAMQQQYMLAAQQQQLAAMPGVFLPNPYIIAAPNTAGYPDPSTSGQFPIMSQYPPYAPWPNVAYPPMISQIAAASAVGNQPPSTGLHPNENRGSDSTLVRERTASPQPLDISQDSGEAPIPPQQPFYPDMLTSAALAGQTGVNQAMAMSGSGYQMLPAFYDQAGTLIVNNGRYGGPVRFVPAPMFLNGSQPSHNSSAIYASPTISGGSTPVPGAVGGSFPPGQQAGIGNMPNMSNFGSFGSGINSQSSTPQRRDSISDYGKQHAYGGGPMAQFYNPFSPSPGSGSMNIGNISPSPGPLGALMGASASHHSMSPPPLSSPTAFGGGRMFSAAPGAEAKYRNGTISNIFGTSGSSLFPPTRIRPTALKDVMGPAGRSRLLDDFRNNRFSNPQLRDLSNHIVEFSRDQHGSRFIQQKLERATAQEKQIVFNEIARAAYQLMTDVFGNYVIQKFFEFGSQEQKLALAKCIQGNVLPLALQMYGCRVIQKALECIPQEEQIEIVKELDGHLIKCVKDQNGNHVVQKCIECVIPSQLQFIIDSFKGEVISLSMHPYGCRVIQRILEHCTPDQTVPILEELHQNYDTLVTDQYGNYVIQHILERGMPESKSKIVLGIRGHVLKLSQHKFASNVVEKCVSNSSRADRALLIEEACKEPDALVIMMKDQYANYVVQKMLDVAELPQRNMLINHIRPHMNQLRKFTYGKHIIAKLDKFLMKTVTTPPIGASTTLAPGACSAPVVLSRDLSSNVNLQNQ